MEREQNKKRRADLLLIGALLLLSGLLALGWTLLREQGALAVVYVDGERTGAYPLSRDASVRLETREGKGWNLLVIENGAADMVDADCPDGLCVRMRPIRYAGESIICLPHRLEVRIEGETGEEADVVLP